jgi:hypothetical protein
MLTSASLLGRVEEEEIEVDESGAEHLTLRAKYPMSIRPKRPRGPGIIGY